MKRGRLDGDRERSKKEEAGGRHSPCASRNNTGKEPEIAPSVPRSGIYFSQGNFPFTTKRLSTLASAAYFYPLANVANLVES